MKTILLKSYSSFDLKNNIYYTYVENYKKSKNMEVLAKKEYEAGIMKECNLDDLMFFLASQIPENTCCLYCIPLV